MEDIGLDFSGFAEGLSVEANLNLDVSLENCFQDGGVVSSQVPEMGELQLPNNRLARQLLQSRAPRTNQLGGVVLQAPGAPGAPLQLHALRTNQLGDVVLQAPGASGAPGAPGAPLQLRTNQPGGVVLQAPGVPGASSVPLQTLTGSQQVLHSSLTAINNPGYQLQPGYHAPPVHIQQPLATGISVIQQGAPLPPVQPMNHVQQTTTVVSGVMPVQRPGPVVIPQIPPSNWMGLSIFSVIFCTFPFGIIALLFSFLVNDSCSRGQYERARKNSEIAKWMNVLALISGTILSCVVLYLIIRANNEI